MESQQRPTEWLEILRIANRDDSEFGRVMRDKDLRVSTKLDEGLTDGDGRLIREHQGRPVRAVVLIAHAGDGKSHFFKELMAHADEGAEPVIPFDPESQSNLEQPGLHVLNDPSLTGSRAVARFLAAAFAPGKKQDGVRFLAGINRGKLRDLLPLVREEDSDAANWLSRALRFEEHTHWPDTHGRLAVPLDRRLLVPGPRKDRQSLRQAPVRELAHRLFAALHRDLDEEGGAPEWAPDEWADRIAVVLALLEAGGHHVTFREALSLSAVVGEGLVESEADALEALFQGEMTFRGNDAVPALRSVLNLLRRLDPARVAVPKVDAEFTDLPTRDAAVRGIALDKLVALFVGATDGSDSGGVPLPYAHGVEFLRLCTTLGGVAESVTRIKHELQTLARQSELGDASPDSSVQRVLDSRLDKLEDDVKVREVPTSFFRGLARFAWGSRAVQNGEQVVPLTSSVQPGTGDGIDRWRVLRGAISRDTAYLDTDMRNYGPFVERGLSLPRFVLDGPENLAQSPSLNLDLELFEGLSRIGEETGPRSLGTRDDQLHSWLDTVVARWEDVLMEPRKGLVVFETLLGSRQEDPVPLRPPIQGPDPVVVSEDFLSDRSSIPTGILDALKLAWPESSRSSSETVAITPSTCASALLQWAGFEPEAGQEESTVHPALREAAGAGSVRNLRQRTNFLSPAFPWSICTLGLAIRTSGGIDYPSDFALGPELGQACATALGLNSEQEQSWKGALRRAWALDEDVFDRHPSSLLCHQWIGAGLDGAQLAHYRSRGAPPDANKSAIGTRVLARLLAEPKELPFSPVERWWLIGTWAAWWLMLEGLREFHGLGERYVPVLVPKVGDDGASAYSRIHHCWFGLEKRHGAKPEDSHAAEALAALGQAAGFLSPSTARTRFDLTLAGGLSDIIRLLAWLGHLEEDEPTDRTIGLVQRYLLESGIFVREGGIDIRSRLPQGTIASSSPTSVSFERAFTRKIESLGLLDASSDGATLVRSPWEATA